MEHSKAVKYWENAASNNPTEKTSKVNPENDFTDFDAAFIRQHTDRSSIVLDLAAGTGMALGKYYDEVGVIDAVELFPEFSKFIVHSDNVNVYNDNIASFEPEKKYDTVLMFGVVQYFSEDEIKELYTKYRDALEPEGKLLIKGQFGVYDDVEVSGVSQELGTEYISQYRHIVKEMILLKDAGFENIEVYDVYPTYANRWDNTHFFALVASD